MLGHSAARLVLLRTSVAGGLGGRRARGACPQFVVVLVPWAGAVASGRRIPSACRAREDAIVRRQLDAIRSSIVCAKGWRGQRTAEGGVEGGMGRADARAGRGAASGPTGDRTTEAQKMLENPQFDEDARPKSPVSGRTYHPPPWYPGAWREMACEERIGGRTLRLFDQRARVRARGGAE